MDIYLDNSATTQPDPKIVEVMAQIMVETYGNPSSMHTKGVDAEKYLTESSRIISDTLRCKPSEILYTSGGTESDNMAIFGVAHARRRAGNHIITTRIEHPAVLEPCRALEREGYEVTYLGTDAHGIINIDELKAAMRTDTILVSVMHTNNEIGSIQPIPEIGDAIKRSNPECVFHVDAVQGYARMPINPRRMNIDLMSVSAHKFHGPRGVGFLYIKDKTRIDPIIYGGGQQKGMRSGTENMPGIYGMALAARKAYEAPDHKLDQMYGLRKYFVRELMKLDGVTINGYHYEDEMQTDTFDRTDEGNDTTADCATQVPANAYDKMTFAPHIVSASFEGVRAEVLLHALEDKGIYVSSGSACSSNRPHISATLESIRLKHELLDSTIRFSFSHMTTGEELDVTLEALRELLPMLRRYTRR